MKIVIKNKSFVQQFLFQCLYEYLSLYIVSAKVGPEKTTAMGNKIIRESKIPNLNKYNKRQFTFFPYCKKGHPRGLNGAK